MQMYTKQSVIVHHVRIYSSLGCRSRSVVIDGHNFEFHALEGSTVATCLRPFAVVSLAVNGSPRIGEDNARPIDKDTGAPVVSDVADSGDEAESSSIRIPLRPRKDVLSVVLLLGMRIALQLEEVCDDDSQICDQKTDGNLW